MDGTVIPQDCSFAPESAISNRCPSSEWEALREYVVVSGHTGPQDIINTYRGSWGPSYFWLSGKNSQRQQHPVHSSDYDIRIAPQGSTTQMVATADALARTAYLWFTGLANVTAKSGHGLPLSYQSDALHTLSGESFQGYSLGVCVDTTIHDAADSLVFPHLYLASNPSTVNANITFNDNFTVGGILHPAISSLGHVMNSTDSSQYQHEWIDLPQPSFNGTSIGAIIFPPQAGSPPSGRSWPQNIILCNLAAGWGSTTLQMHTAISSTDQSVSRGLAADVDETGHSLYTALKSQNSDKQFNFNHPQYPEKPINVTKEWAQYLNPIVRSANATVFDLMMRDIPVLHGAESHNWVARQVTGALVSMMSNGFSRIGFDRTLQGCPKSIPSSNGAPWTDSNYWLSGKGDVFDMGPDHNKEWIKLHVSSSIESYAYNTQTVAPRITIAVLMTYCILALAHVFTQA